VTLEVSQIVRVFFWSGSVALLCWLAVMALQAIPSFRDAARPRPEDEMDGADPEQPQPASGQH
jgi:hypothetical protein